MSGIRAFQRQNTLLLVIIGLSLGLVGFTLAQDDTDEPTGLWDNATDTTIGATSSGSNSPSGWTNKVELADINGDGLVDTLFANGGNYDKPGVPASSQAFINNGPTEMFTNATEAVFGDAKMLARVIKVRDVDGDDNPDIIVGTTFETQSRLYLGDGAGGFTDMTATHFPQIEASIGDLELGDVDGDGDLDMVLADWGAGSPMNSEGGRTKLWLNDGTGHFTDVTSDQTPDVLVRFSWELEFVDVDNDYDLDILISCKRCRGSYLFENDGAGNFTDVSADRLPQYTNNYDFEAMDLDGDSYLDLITINDGPGAKEHIFRNNQRGGFEDANEELWLFDENIAGDDNVIVFLDFDSDGDADFLIGSLSISDRLMINDGTGHLTLAENVFTASPSRGTLYMAVADLNGDGRLDVAEAQGEIVFDNRVHFGANIAPDTAPPIITLVETLNDVPLDETIQVRARVHDNKSPTMPHDWQAVELRWTSNGQTHSSPMAWYGEYLWRGVIDDFQSGSLDYQVCAIDAAGNEACSPQQTVNVG
jgi:hypothetical protein